MPRIPNQLHGVNRAPDLGSAPESGALDFWFNFSRRYRLRSSGRSLVGIGTLHTPGIHGCDNVVIRRAAR